MALLKTSKLLTKIDLLTTSERLLSSFSSELARRDRKHGKTWTRLFFQSTISNTKKKVGFFESEYQTHTRKAKSKKKRDEKKERQKVQRPTLT